MPTGAATTDALGRGPISVRGWKVFGPGLHKGELYSPARCRQIAANFAALRGFVTPTVKVGHDKSQRLAKSLGFPNAGTVPVCVADEAGVVTLDLAALPPEVAAKINAGQLNSGSIELKENVPDPRDPAKRIPGDVLVAVALLGEEQPAVPGFAPPRATYADGTEVEPDHSAAEWLTAMADVAKAMSAEFADADRGTVICFSEMYQEPPVTPEDIIAALAAMSPDDKAKIAAALASDPAAAPPAGADPGNMAVGDGSKNQAAQKGAMEALDPWPRGKNHSADATDPAAKPGGAPVMTMADMAKCMSDLTARVGSMEAAKTAQMSAEGEEKEKAFAAEVGRVVDTAVKAGILQPWQKADYILAGKAKDRTKVFSDGAHKGKTEFAAWAANLTAGNVKAFSDSIADTGPAVAPLTPGGRAVLSTLKITNPRVAERLTAAAG